MPVALHAHKALSNRQVTGKLRRAQVSMSSCSFPVFQEKEGEWTSPKTFLMEGIPIHQFFTPNPAALRDYIVNFQTRADDVFVVSYPKSGKPGFYGKAT